MRQRQAGKNDVFKQTIKTIADDKMVGELFDVLQNTSLSEIYPVMGYIQKQREKQTPEQQKKGALKLREVLVGCNYQSYVTLLGESVM